MRFVKLIMQGNIQQYLQESFSIWKSIIPNASKTDYEPDVNTISAEKDTQIVWLMYKEIPSTMLVAEKWSPKLVNSKTAFAFQALRQSQGKGQGTNAWMSPPGNLYVTMLLQIDFQIAPFLSIIACSSIMKTISQEVPGLKTNCKWVNDILIQRKKVSGVLVNCSMQGQQLLASIGIGLNIQEAPLQISTHLSKDTHKKVDLNSFTERLLTNVIHGMQNKEESLQLYKSSLLFLNEKVKIFDRSLTNVLHQGVFKGINQAGHALLQVNEQVITVHDGRMRQFEEKNQEKLNK